MSRRRAFNLLLAGMLGLAGAARAGTAPHIDAQSFTASDGTEMPNRGVYLEVVANERLVFTDAYTEAWKPSDKPFMTVILSFDPVDGGKTRNKALVRHWTVADREAHEQMGFHTGWGQCTDQLAELVKTL